MSVKRIYVEKKPEFAVKAHELLDEIGSYLGIGTVDAVRVLIRYDIENLSEAVYREALDTIFSEPPVDICYEETFPKKEGDLVKFSKDRIFIQWMRNFFIRRRIIRAGFYRD